MKPKLIEFAGVTIIERPGENLPGHEELYALDIFINTETNPHRVYVMDIRVAILRAMELQMLGMNSDFTTFAARMLMLDGEIWS
jgi:hypothetical protein